MRYFKYLLYFLILSLMMVSCAKKVDISVELREEINKEELEGFTVICQNKDEPRYIYRLTTDTNGIARVSGTKEGNYEITINHYPYVEYKNTYNIHQDTYFTIKLSYYRFDFSGKIKEEHTGIGLSEAKITITQKNSDIMKTFITNPVVFKKTLKYNCLSKSGGSFQFKDVPVGAYSINVIKSKFQPIFTEINIDADINQNFSLKADKLVLKGKVIDEHNRPVSGAEVTFYYTNDFYEKVVTNVKGEYYFLVPDMKSRMINVAKIGLGSFKDKTIVEGIYLNEISDVVIKNRDIVLSNVERKYKLNFTEYKPPAPKKEIETKPNPEKIDNPDTEEVMVSKIIEQPEKKEKPKVEQEQIKEPEKEKKTSPEPKKEPELKIEKEPEQYELKEKPDKTVEPVIKEEPKPIEKESIDMMSITEFISNIKPVKDYNIEYIKYNQSNLTVSEEDILFLNDYKIIGIIKYINSNNDAIKQIYINNENITKFITRLNDNNNIAIQKSDDIYIIDTIRHFYKRNNLIVFELYETKKTDKVEYLESYKNDLFIHTTGIIEDSITDIDSISAFTYELLGDNFIKQRSNLIWSKYCRGLEYISYKYTDDDWYEIYFIKGSDKRINRKIRRLYQDTIKYTAANTKKIRFFDRIAVYIPKGNPGNISDFNISWKEYPFIGINSSTNKSVDILQEIATNIYIKLSKKDVSVE